jgi:hypothetical protein
MSRKPKSNELGKKTTKIIKKSKRADTMEYLRRLGGDVEMPTKEEILTKRQASLAKARDAIDYKNPEFIAKLQVNMTKARDAIDYKAPNVIAALQANLTKANLNNPSHIKHKYNELFDECIQIPETPRDE